MQRSLSTTINSAKQAKVISNNMRRSARVATAAIARMSAASVRSSNAASSTVAKGARRGVKRVAAVTVTAVDTASVHVQHSRLDVKHELPGDENVESANATSIAIKQERVAATQTENKLSISSDIVKSESTSTAATAAKTDIDTKQCEWHRLCSTLELSCKLTLASGQTFAWRYDPQTCEWSGVVGHNVFALREHYEHVEFQCLHPLDCACSGSSSLAIRQTDSERLTSIACTTWWRVVPLEQALAILTHYFRLEVRRPLSSRLSVRIVPKVYPTLINALTTCVCV